MVIQGVTYKFKNAQGKKTSAMIDGVKETALRRRLGEMKNQGWELVSKMTTANKGKTWQNSSLSNFEQGYISQKKPSQPGTQKPKPGNIGLKGTLFTSLTNMNLAGAKDILANPGNYTQSQITAANKFFGPITSSAQQSGAKTQSDNPQGPNYVLPPSGRPMTSGEAEAQASRFNTWIRNNPNAVVPKDINTDPNNDYITKGGVLMLQSSADKAARLAADPNMINVGTAKAPKYIPKGSAAEANMSNIGKTVYQPPSAQAQQAQQAQQSTYQPTLIEITSQRPDVLSEARKQGGDPYTAGTGANRWLNDWYNRIGKAEGADMARRGLFDKPSAQQPQLQQPQAQKPPAPALEVPETLTSQQINNDGLNEVLAQNAELQLEPIQSIQQVFGQDWQPAPIFEELGLTQQGIYGAVRIKGQNDVYTIGPGGRLETAESFQTRFGTSEQQGIVGEVSMEEALMLGIVPSEETLLEDLNPADNIINPDGYIPPEITPEMTAEEKAEVSKGIYDEAKVEAGVPELKEERDKAYQGLIDKLESAWETFTGKKEEQKKELKLEEKSAAIAAAGTAYTDSLNAYNKTLEKLRHEAIPMDAIYGQQARVRTQQALDLAPLATAIQIAQGSYDRAKGLLDEFSNDWKESMQWSLTAAQLKIDMISGNLTEAQNEAKFNAQAKLDWYVADYNQVLQNQEEVKKLMLAFPQASVNINDTWETAYSKISPYVSSEVDLQNKMNALNLESAELGVAAQRKDLAKPYYKPGTPSDSGNKEFTRVKQIIAQHPNEWGHAADQIDQEFGAGTATKYDDYLKGVYAGEGDKSPVEIFQEYKDAGYTREETENSYKKEFMSKTEIEEETAVPGVIKSALDQVFGVEEKKGFWDFLKG